MITLAGLISALGAIKADGIPKHEAADHLDIDSEQTLDKDLLAFALNTVYQEREAWMVKEEFNYSGRRYGQG